MVGVPRSKGCRICVQRRVKCDETRPTCNNCGKGNRPCPGYDQDLKFQDETTKIRKRFRKAKIESPHDGTSRAASINQTAEEIFNFDVPSSSQGQSFLDQDHMLSSLTENLPSRTITPHQLPGEEDWTLTGVEFVDSDVPHAPLAIFSPNQQQEISFTHGKFSTNLFNPDSDDVIFDYFGQVAQPIFSPNLEQQQLLETFTSSLFSEIQSHTLPIQMRFHQKWFNHLPKLSGTNNLLDTAVRAATLAHLGRVHQSEVLLEQSRPLYGKALRLLNSSITNTEKGVQSETLCSTVLLSYYEMFASDSNDSWVRHAGGSGALMRVRGPSRHRTGVDRDILLAYRHTVVIQSFQDDTPCFLDDPEWRALFRQIYQDLRNSGLPPDRLDFFDLGEEFFNEMASIPAAVHAARHVNEGFKKSGMSNKREFCQSITERVKMHRANMKSIFARMGAALAKCGSSPTIRQEPDDRVFSISYEFINMSIGSSFMGYWTILIILNLILMELDMGTNPGQTTLYMMENLQLATDTCRTIKYATKSSFLGPFFAIFALRCALIVFGQGPERDWVLKKLREIAESRMSMAKHIPGFSPGFGMPLVKRSMNELNVSDLDMRSEEVKAKSRAIEEQAAAS